MCVNMLYSQNVSYFIKPELWKRIFLDCSHLICTVLWVNNSFWWWLSSDRFIFCSCCIFFHFRCFCMLCVVKACMHMFKKNQFSNGIFWVKWMNMRKKTKTLHSASHLLHSTYAEHVWIFVIGLVSSQKTRPIQRNTSRPTTTTYTQYNYRREEEKTFQ